MTAPPIDPTGADRRVRLVLTTLPSAEEAERLAGSVVDRRLAACGSFWPVRSVFRWRGSVDRVQEQALLFKTSAKKVGALFRHIVRHHPYEVPEILEIPLPRVHEPYVAWLLSSVDPGSGPGPLTRPAGRRGRAARGRRRTRAPRRRRSR